VVARLGIVPAVLPSIRLVAAAVPFSRRGQISHHGLEPDIDPLRLVAGNGDLDAPVQIAGDRPGLQTLPEPAPHEGEHVVPPMFLVLRGPLGGRLFERSEREEEVLRFPWYWRP